LANGFSKGIFEFFNKWKKETIVFNRKLRKDITIRLIKTCDLKLKDAFQNWKVQKFNSLKTQQKSVIEGFQEEG
jgi:hypothetical protein